MPFTADAAQILVVDDSPPIAGVLREVLRAEGYSVAIASDGMLALEAVARNPPDLIFLDLNLPRLDGYEVCRRLKADPATRLTPVVILTAQSEMQSKLEAWDLGADDFLTKPFQLIEVTSRCRSLLRIKRLVEERESAESVVFALARAVEAKSPFTHGHSERVRSYALTLADAVGCTALEREQLGKGALLHDIGKISIPDAVLNKPGRLTKEEFDQVKEHTTSGAHIVEPLHSLRDVVGLIRWHHERLDGAGYPDGLRGNEIPQLVRILTVADIFDSLISDRPYRAPMPIEKAIAILRSGASDGGLDSDLVDVFCRLMLGNATSPGDTLPMNTLATISPSRHMLAETVSSRK